MAETELTVTKGKLESVIDSTYLSNHLTPPTESVLKEDLCWKRKYSRGTYELVIYRASADIRDLHGSAAKPLANNVDKKRCFSQAVAEIKDLHLEYSERILNTYQGKFRTLWSDEDIGPVKWLFCDEDKEGEFTRSQGTMLHELTHDLRIDDCLFDESTANSVCFHFPANLPPRSFAKLDKFPTKIPEAIQALNAIQDIYLRAADGSFLLLLDEIRAFGITTQVVAQQMRIKGKSSIYFDSSNAKTRNYVVLPQMIYYGVHYLELLKSKKPDLYKKLVGEKETVTKLKQLLATAESRYRDWLSALAEVKEKPKEPEENFWRDYILTKKNLQLF